jgi:HAD superfamily hydrolase (TIGR01459 family)
VTAAAGATLIGGLSEIATGYEAFFVDQFGVLHDGSAPYPHAAETLLRLTGAGKRVVLLSNSGKRSAPNELRLERLGFSRQGWTDFLSSGEVAWSILAAELASEPRRRRCLLLARDGDRSPIEGLSIDVTDSGADCDLVLIAGSEGDARSLEDYHRLLAPAAARAVPAYCTNPDKQMLTPLGLRFGAGAIAALYEELGGKVIWIGKPFPAIYSAARNMIGDMDPKRILCIGDSVEHDIAGALGAGLDSCLVTGGILQGLDRAGLAALYAETGAVPDLVISGFRW